MAHVEVQRQTNVTLKHSKSKKSRSHLGGYILIYFITFVVMIPFLWMLLLSFKTNSEILNSPFSLPESFSFQNYQKAIETLDILLMYKNTFIIAGITIVGQIIITFMSSFALSRMVFKSKKLKGGLNFYFLLGLAIPPFILLFPVYRLTIELGLMNTHASLVLPYIATSISFNSLLFIGFLKGFPKEIEEAAIIDGCNLFSLCSKVVLPMIMPVVATIFIFNILYVWNEFPFAVTLISDESLSTIPLGISEFKGRWSIDYGGIIAASILIMIPQLVFFGFFQKYIIEGMTAGAVKG
ncbi:carbohydrate ABC transporter permease [Neobacillus sp. 179-C4.2 HS]|uniref:Carbohydrate ABC transporter permease n=1 Tax=Neobacillus driksii TaxID=3035913 RepID=A0ABV4YRW3_9BACI|nr:carbohydrate ABC transporter permease [Neobacillus sp. 179.-C4.2 HS]MDP5194289.1 carbohydrate ABC transporter permease [Neobacillus sp. 179.-C4.2 HS]